MTHEDAVTVFRALRIRSPNLGAKLLWFVLALTLGDDMPTLMSQAQLARLLDTKSSTVRRSLATLEE